MSGRSASIGAGLLGVLAIASIIIALTAGPPAAILVILLVLGVVALGGLGMWVAGRSRRPAMWTAVAAMVVAALLAIPPMLFPEATIGDRLLSVVFIVLTAVAVFLVRGELGREARRAPSTAPAA